MEELFPGASFAWVEGGEIECGAVGHHAYNEASPKVTPETVYDVASLTKVIGPMSVATQLVDEGVLSLDTKVADLIPEFATEPQKKEVALHHLLTYTVDYKTNRTTKEAIAELNPYEFLNEVITLPLANTPGTTYCYTDITVIILTELLARVTGTNLPRLVKDRFFSPLGLNSATFDPGSLSPRVNPPTEITEDRGVVIGRIHDEKADHLLSGGIYAGLAGLFVSVEDVAKYLRMVTNRGMWGEVRYWSEDMCERFYTDQFPNITSSHTPLVWGDRFGQPGYELLSREYTPSLYEEYSGTLLTKGGFTGCFMAVDLTRQRAIAFLSNHTFPKRRESHKAINLLKEKCLDIL